MCHEGKRARPAVKGEFPSAAGCKSWRMEASAAHTQRPWRSDYSLPLRNHLLCSPGRYSPDTYRIFQRSPGSFPDHNVISAARAEGDHKFNVLCGDPSGLLPEDAAGVPAGSDVLPPPEEVLPFPHTPQERATLRPPRSGKQFSFLFSFFILYNRAFARSYIRSTPVTLSFLPTGFVIRDLMGCRTPADPASAPR